MLNKTFIQGNVTRDPEVRFSQAGHKIASFGLAWNETRKGEETVHFYNVVVMGNTADFVENFVKKGSGVIVEGQLRQNRWVDEATSQKRSNYEIFVGFTGSINFSGSKRQAEEGAEAGAPTEGETEGATSSIPAVVGDKEYF